jgi:hypothetical protein
MLRRLRRAIPGKFAELVAVLFEVLRVREFSPRRRRHAARHRARAMTGFA